jgi:hypothetical protein
MCTSPAPPVLVAPNPGRVPNDDRLPTPALDGGEGKIICNNQCLNPPYASGEPLESTNTTNSGPVAGKPTANGLVSYLCPTATLTPDSLLSYPTVLPTD